MEIYFTEKRNICNNFNISYIILSYIYFKKFNLLLKETDIIKNENGKPYLKNNKFFFNISHSKNYIICVISKHEVGIDIEENRKIKENALRKFLTKSEFKLNKKALINPLEYWVIKEAFVKYLGLGLKFDISKISVNSIEDMCIANKIENPNFTCYVLGKEIDKKLSYIKKETISNFIKNNHFQ